MKTLKLIALAAFALLFACCKATQPSQAVLPTPSLMQTYTVLDGADSVLFNFASNNGGNGKQAMMQTASWLRTQSSIEEATVIDSTFMNIQLKSGVITSLFLDQI